MENLKFKNYFSKIHGAEGTGLMQIGHDPASLCLTEYSSRRNDTLNVIFIIGPNENPQLTAITQIFPEFHKVTLSYGGQYDFLPWSTSVSLNNEARFFQNHDDIVFYGIIFIHPCPEDFATIMRCFDEIKKIRLFLANHYHTAILPLLWLITLNISMHVDMDIFRVLNPGLGICQIANLNSQIIKMEANRIFFPVGNSTNFRKKYDLNGEIASSNESMVQHIIMLLNATRMPEQFVGIQNPDEKYDTNFAISLSSQLKPNAGFPLTQDTNVQRPHIIVILVPQKSKADDTSFFAIAIYTTHLLLVYKGSTYENSTSQSSWNNILGTYQYCPGGMIELRIMMVSSTLYISFLINGEILINQAIPSDKIRIEQILWSATNDVAWPVIDSWVAGTLSSYPSYKTKAAKNTERSHTREYDSTEILTVSEDLIDLGWFLKTTHKGHIQGGKEKSVLLAIAKIESLPIAPLLESGSYMIKCNFTNVGLNQVDSEIVIELFEKGMNGNGRKIEQGLKFAFESFLDFGTISRLSIYTKPGSLMSFSEVPPGVRNVNTQIEFIFCLAIFSDHERYLFLISRPISSLRSDQILLLKKWPLPPQNILPIPQGRNLVCRVQTTIRTQYINVEFQSLNQKDLKFCSVLGIGTPERYVTRRAYNKSYISGNLLQPTHEDREIPSPFIVFNQGFHAPTSE